MENKQDTFKKIDTLIYERWFHRLVSHWHLFLISVILSIASAFVYLRYTKTVYSVSSTVLVKDVSQNINPLDPAARTNDMGGFSRTYNLTNEIKVLMSRRLIEETIKNLDWQVSYFIVGNIKNTEVYRFSDFRVIFPDSNNKIPFETEFKITFFPNNKFRISNEKLENKGWNFTKTYKSNQLIDINGFKFAIKVDSNNLAGSDYSFIIRSKLNVIAELSAKIKVAQYDKSSSILSVSSQGTCIEKELDFINNHCNSFVKMSLNDKNQVQERTIGFIEAQLNNISDTLQVLENKMILYRKKFNSSNVEAIAEKRFIKLELLEEEKAKYLLNKRYFEYLRNYLNEKSEFSDIVAPANVGIVDPVLNGLINQLIEQKLKQNTSFKVENSTSPFRIDNENKINQIKKNISEVLMNIQKSNDILYQDILRRIEQVNQLTSSILDNERNYLDLKRKYKINEELYNKLLIKKSELGITRAGNVSDTKIVDFAYITGAPYPNPTNIYITFIGFSLLLPLIYILFKYLTNYKIMDKHDIINVCDMPFLGSIGHITTEDRMIVINKPKSLLAESFRGIRANLYFFLPNKDQKVILVTSSLSGEGKTFTSLNIASVLAVSGKKILLIGADMRKPKVYLDIDIRDQEGLSNYLAGKVDLKNIILDTSVRGLDFISAGSLPPNPAELLTNQKMDALFEEVRKTYDYIIVDTPPVGLVTDAIPLIKHSDLIIYVVRHNYTQTKYLEELAELVSSGIIKKFVYIFNDFDVAKNYGYGYRYGYYRNAKDKSGYYINEESLSKYKKFMRRFKKKSR